MTTDLRNKTNKCGIKTKIISFRKMLNKKIEKSMSVFRYNGFQKDQLMMI